MLCCKEGRQVGRKGYAALSLSNHVSASPWQNLCAVWDTLYSADRLVPLVMALGRPAATVPAPGHLPA